MKNGITIIEIMLLIAFLIIVFLFVDEAIKYAEENVEPRERVFSLHILNLKINISLQFYIVLYPALYYNYIIN